MEDKCSKCSVKCGTRRYCSELVYDEEKGVLIPCEMLSDKQQERMKEKGNETSYRRKFTAASI
jgi:hypothetical protein